METQNNSAKTERVFSIMKHVMAIIIIGIPIVIVGMVGLINPSYVGRLFIADRETGYFGLIITFLALAIIAITYLLVIALCNTLIAMIFHETAGKRISWGIIKMLLLGVAIILLIGFILLWGLTGPAALLIINFPFGKMFFGG